MKTHGMWTGWSLRIGDRAFKNVRPIAMNIQRRVVTKKVKGFWFFSEYERFETDEWEIVFVYDRGPLTQTHSSTIIFSTESEARVWFNDIFSQVFLRKGSRHNIPPPPKSRKTKVKKSHLSLVKDKL